jgi:soluble lytic murein transglycosylase-like protein
MNIKIVTPAALLVIVSSVAAALALALEDSSPSAAPEAASTETAALPAPACLPKRAHGPDRVRRYDAAILRHARRRGLNPRLVKAIIAVESQFTPTALSHCGARGLMQVMPATAKDLGVKACDLWDPETNISAGTAYLALLFKQARKGAGPGDAEEALVMRRVIAAYYAGPSALEASAWSEATRRYVRDVLNCYTPAKDTARVLRTEDSEVASLRDGEESVW